VNFSLISKSFKLVFEEKNELYEICDGVRTFGCDPELKYNACLTSIINVLTENKDKDVLALSLISNIYSTIAFNKNTERSYGEEIHRKDERAKKELSEFLD